MKTGGHMGWAGECTEDAAEWGCMAMIRERVMIAKTSRPRL
mgnify:CR=1 FL=1